MPTFQAYRILRGTAFVVLGLLPLAASAATLHVPADYPAIQDAIEHAEFGDTVLVEPGTYQENLFLKDGLIVKSVAGPDETIITYGGPSKNEAVVLAQSCSNSTQLIGFTVTGADLAKRGILLNAETEIVIQHVKVTACTYGIAIHGRSNPFLHWCDVSACTKAALFVQYATADVKYCTFTGCEAFGVYITGTSEALSLKECAFSDNLFVGIQASDAEFSVEGGSVNGNGDTGILAQSSSVIVTNATIEDNINVGVVFEDAGGVIDGCSIARNSFGVVASGKSAPSLVRNTFLDNPSYHLGIEGTATPTIGGDLDSANDFLGEAKFLLQSSSTEDVVATHNYWGKPCVPKKRTSATEGEVATSPWASKDHSRTWDDCAASRQANAKAKKAAEAAAAKEAAENAPPDSTVGAASVDGAGAAPGTETADG
ncbi:MAG: right-handed parallel beta-helix repeat-containing protein [Gemmatimonadota bacterium]|nr:right-handed parallel beta-helix repeat-containing protein [Gemmatimonadota bacterium]MDP6802606.1 right-handed parallel beta-helix repeat-containing protein [Gemmatimonadota bacterium]MDP7030731.1 right-handed parallel beta-helix repeat-containing protein [Gemmatimonadota bacterium]